MLTYVYVVDRVLPILYMRNEIFFSVPTVGKSEGTQVRKTRTRAPA